MLINAELLQWNPSIAATIGEQNVGRYIGVVFIEGLFCTQTVHLGPGPGRYTEVAVKRRSTVIINMAKVTCSQYRWLVARQC